MNKKYLAFAMILMCCTLAINIDYLMPSTQTIFQQTSDFGNAIKTWIWDHIVIPMGTVFSEFITIIGTAIVDGFRAVINAIFNVVRAMINVPAQAIGRLSEGVKRVISSLFGLGLLVYGVHGITSTYDGNYSNKHVISAILGASIAMFPIAIPPIGFAIAGVVIGAVGAAVVGISARVPPPLSGIVSGFGWMIIVIGAMIGLYGIMPKYSLWLYAAGFVIIFIVGIWTILSYIRRS